MLTRVFLIAMLLLPGPALALQCQHSPSDAGAWSWRTVDGQKCWYVGRRVVPKGELHWPQQVASAIPMAPPKQSWLEKVSKEATPAEIYFPTLTAGNLLETYPRMIWPQPWLSADSVMNWPVLLDIDRKPFVAWTRRIGD